MRAAHPSPSVSRAWVPDRPGPQGIHTIPIPTVAVWASFLEPFLAAPRPRLSGCPRLRPDAGGGRGARGWYRPAGGTADALESAPRRPGGRRGARGRTPSAFLCDAESS